MEHRRSGAFVLQGVSNRAITAVRARLPDVPWVETGVLSPAEAYAVLCDAGIEVRQFVTVVDAVTAPLEIAAVDPARHGRAARWFDQVEACDHVILVGHQGGECAEVLRALQPRASMSLLSDTSAATLHAAPEFSPEITPKASAVYDGLIAMANAPTFTTRSHAMCCAPGVFAYRAHAPVSEAAWKTLMERWPREIVRSFGRVSIEGARRVLDQRGRNLRDVTTDDEPGGYDVEIVCVAPGLDLRVFARVLDEALRG